MKVLRNYGLAATLNQGLHRIRQAICRSRYLVLLLWFIVPMTAMAGQPTQRLDYPHDPQKILVRLVPGATAQGRSNLHLSMGATLLKEYTLVDGLALVEVAAADLAQKLLDYQSDPMVLYAEPDYILQTTTPNDEYYCALWGMNNTGVNLDGCTNCVTESACKDDPGTTNSDINVEDVWSLGQWTGDPEFKIAVIDGGINYLHPDLEANIWTNPDEIPNNGIDDDENGYIDDVHGYDFIDPGSEPMDENGHGSHVAGIIGAVGNNGIGVTGVNWQCKLVAIRVCSSAGCPCSAIVDGIEYAVANNIRLSNNSYGGSGFLKGVEDAIAAAQSMGHLFVASAGNLGRDNDGITPNFPSSYNLPNIIAVAMMDNDDNKSPFSHFGAKSVDLGAPGVNVYSTFLSPDYAYLSGTSMASPHVTGVAALLWSKFPNMTWNQVRDRLLSTVRHVSSLEGITATEGIVDAFVAVVDCNNNGILDHIDIFFGTSADCNANLIPDECEIGGDVDCDGDGTFDLCELDAGTSNDCNENHIPDECEPGAFEDCNLNGSFDLCDIFTGASSDCNENFIPDSCDIASGTSEDILPINNADGIPDECIYLLVSANATGTGTGRTWVNAITSIGDALEKAKALISSGSPIQEIWVASGTYYEAICLIDEIDLYGGFAGFETSRDQRDYLVNETIISADRDGNDASGIFTDNAASVVDASGTSSVTAFDGFTLKDARHTLGLPQGGGIYCEGCNLNIDHCHIRDNVSASGGGMVVDGGTPTIRNTIFSDNVANVGAGGAININSGVPTFDNCVFANNQLYRLLSSGGGGAVYVKAGTEALFRNCTFSENNADFGAQAIEAIGTVNLVNSIVWQNSTGTVINGTANITYSDIKGGSVGIGNIDVDPLFIDPIGGNLRVRTTSPVIDAGDSSVVSEPLDLDGSIRIAGSAVDMGSYESNFNYIPLTTVSGEDGFTKDRYLSFNPGIGNAAIRVTWPNGTDVWVGCAGTPFSSGDGIGFNLVDNIEFCDWQIPVIHVTGCQVRPGETYTIDATEDGFTFTSAIVVVTTPPQLPDRFYGDIVGMLDGAFWSAPDGVVTTNDIVGIIKGFILESGAPHSARLDITGRSPNQIVAMDDILNVVLAFAGDPYPLAWECGGPSGSSGGGPVSTYSLVANSASINPGQTVDIDVFIDAATDLTGYEVALNLSAWGLGSLNLDSMTIDENRSDFVFNGKTIIKALDNVTGRFGVITDDASSVTVTSTGYLGTLTYQASLDADGLFNIVIGSGERAFLLNSASNRITTDQGSSILVGVDVFCTDDAYCDDGNSCTDDICDPQVGCSNVGNDANTCDDGNSCTTTVCLSGVCQATNLPSGTSCNDGLSCTGIDTCDGAGVCDHTGNRCQVEFMT